MCVCVCSLRAFVRARVCAYLFVVRLFVSTAWRWRMCNGKADGMSVKIWATALLHAVWVKSIVWTHQFVNHARRYYCSLFYVQPEFNTRTDRERLETNRFMQLRDSIWTEFRRKQPEFNKYRNVRRVDRCDWNRRIRATMFLSKRKSVLILMKIAVFWRVFVQYTAM